MQTAGENLESAILFDVKEEALTDMTLSEHIIRLSVTKWIIQNMRDYLNTAISNNRINL